MNCWKIFNTLKKWKARFCFMLLPEGPVLLHVITKKGKGFSPAEDDKVGTWHGTGPYKMETGDLIKPVNTAPAWSALVSETVRKLAREDQRIVAVTPAMPVGSKLEKFAEENLLRNFRSGCLM